MTHRQLEHGSVVVLSDDTARAASIAAVVKALQPHVTVATFTSTAACIRHFDAQRGVFDPSAAPAPGWAFSGLIWAPTAGPAATIAKPDSGADAAAASSTPLSEAAVDAALSNGAVAHAALHLGAAVVVIPFATAASTDADAAARLIPVAGYPLLSFASSSDVAAATGAFLKFPLTPGRVVVIEGGDGAGKQTQTGMLLARLRAAGRAAETIDFPHDRAQYGVLIRQILAGHKGSLRDVSPLVFATLYGVNRHDCGPLIHLWLLRGAIVVLDRWTTANYGHQASKLKSKEEREAAIAQLRTFETRWLGLPDADRVLYLDLPPAYAMWAMKRDKTRKALDLHELAGVEYKENVRSAFLWCCDELAGWRRVACVKGDISIDALKHHVGVAGEGTATPTAVSEAREDEEDSTTPPPAERLTRESVHEAVWAAVEEILPPLATE
jgi:thymidylate kinase